MAASKPLTAVCVLLLVTSALFATGPSFIKAEINPVAVNDKGEVLCRTRYEANPMGSSTFVDIEYGFCILSHNTIIEPADRYVLKYSPLYDMEAYLEHRAHWDSVFASPLDTVKPTDAERMYIGRYGFNRSNAAEYSCVVTTTVGEFMRERGTDLSAEPQKALRGGTGRYLPGGERDPEVRLVYDFGNILVFRHEESYEKQFPDSRFDYLNPIFGDEQVEYEISVVSGVLFLND
ncbi:MAG: hypothetical protein LUE26_08790 [Alistipes sp.]|nr:hypothetical protein [Alistipes sp.]